MVGKKMQRIYSLALRLANTVGLFKDPFRKGYEPALAPLAPQFYQPNSWLPDLDGKSNGFLWGVPKKRRTIQVRWCRNMGAKDLFWKMLIPKTNLRICETCGHHYEAKHLCRNCYEKIKKESEQIREAIETKLGTNPENQSVVVLYGSEKDSVDPQFTTNKLLVEVEKERPAWFSKNLLQKTTAKPDGETTIVTVTKPNLG